jgi:hypothetical protein
MVRMRRSALALVASIALAASLTAAEKRPAAEQAKIDWLLDRVQTSDAVFIRNGKEYDGRKAAGHLKTKLWWAGDRVQTARDFIQGVASKSEESGKPYEVRLGNGKSQPLGDWLFERLGELEKSPPK